MVDITAKTYRLDTSVEEKDVLFYNIKKEPFRIYGLYSPQKNTPYIRLPEQVANATNSGVAQLAWNTAGGRLRFSTDSPYIVIKAEMPKISRFPHMPLTGTSGFDVYLDSDGGSRYLCSKYPEVDAKDGFEGIIRLGSRKMRSFTINFPSYNALNALHVGLAETARVAKGKEYINKKPVVFYGSSITQGGCSSRPGLIYQNMISRRYNLDYTNLGFSGSGRAELPIVKYMASLDMLAFVSDYDHNAPDANYLRETHSRMYDIIRESHPDIPYIMVSRPDTLMSESFIERRDVIIDTFRRARELGDTNVYYIDGEGLFRGPYEDCCTVDGCHPNDLGMMKMAEGIGRVLERALRKTDFRGEDNE